MKIILNIKFCRLQKMQSLVPDRQEVPWNAAFFPHKNDETFALYLMMPAGRHLFWILDTALNGYALWNSQYKGSLALAFISQDCNRISFEEKKLRGRRNEGGRLIGFFFIFWFYCSFLFLILKNGQNVQVREGTWLFF